MINPDYDFWQEAQDFVKPLAISELETKFIEYCKERKFNNNEIILFKHSCEQAVSLRFTMGSLKLKI